MEGKFKVGDIVLIRETEETVEIIKKLISTMGRSIYYVKSKEFSEDFCFYEHELMSVDDMLLQSGYSDYLDKTIERVSKIHRKTLDRLEPFDKSENGGVKDDRGKLRYSLLEPSFINDMLEVLEFGARKYGDENWKGLDKKRVEDALFRHYQAYLLGESLDKDTGKSHMVHIGCCAMFLDFLNKEYK